MTLRLSPVGVRERPRAKAAGMSVLKVFTDAATGVFSPQTIAPASPTPRVQTTPRPPTEKNEDAAKISLSSAAREFAATAKDVPARTEAPLTQATGESSKQSEVEAPENLEQASTNEGETGAEQNSSEAGTEQEGQFSAEEERTIRELQARDREVRAHEQAHLNALGQHRSGGASYTYTTGPDGKQYATAGSVPVNVSPESTPEQTIAKAQVVRRAALAPAEPSGADRAVAASASQLEAQARAELNAERRDDEPVVGETEAPNTSEENAEVATSAPDESEAEFFSGRLVGASAQAFQSSVAYGASSSDRGSLLDLQA